jgi:hypothetical protein
MANGEFIEFLSKEALKDLQTANAELVTMISNVDKVGTKMKGITTPSGSDSAIKGLTAEYQKQEKIIANLQNKVVKANEVAQRQAEKTRLAEIKLAQQREQAFDKFEKSQRKEQALIEKGSGLYNKTQNAVNQLSQMYNNLAIKKAYGHTLSVKEEAQLHKLTKEINIYQTALKKVDADIQKNQRNVGNYASGWNGLGNSINQLSREMPAFANSAQTGFMALSNNLPILFDEITKIKNANKDLIAQGKPIQSTFSQIVGAVLSWQTALSIGVTLLTLYGAKIWDSISGAKEKKKALEAEKKAIEEKVEAERRSNETIGQSIAQEQNRARILFEIAKNNEINDTKRNEALKELRERYGKYLKDLTDQQILAGQTAEAEERLNKALLGRGYALATQNLLEQNATAQMSAQVEYQKVLSKGFKYINNQKNDKGAIKNNEDYWKSLRKTNNENTKAEKILNEKLKPLKAEEELLLSLFRDNAKYLDAVNETTKAHEKKVKVLKEEEQITTNSEEAFKKSIASLEKQLANTDRFSTAYGVINGLLEVQKGLYDQLFGSIKKVNDETKDYIELTDEQVFWDSENKAEETAKAIIKLRLATEDYIKTLSNDAFNKAFDNIGLSSAKMFFDFDENGLSTFDKLFQGADTFKEKFAVTFQAVGDVAQDVFNKINEMSNQRFENQRMNLEREYKIGLAFAGDSATARAEIERQYQDRQRELQRREFKAKKQQALVNIAMDTAQGVVSALASTPPNIPLSITIGVIGAVQAGLVASQQMPQFWKGTDNAPEGWALTQERGREIITDSKGNIKSLGNDKGATMTYLNKGDKVKTASETMDYLMFNNELNAMLTNNSIDKSPSVNIQNTNIDLSPVVKAINDKPVANIGIDKDGLKMHIITANQEKEVMNKRKTFSGITT